MRDCGRIRFGVVGLGRGFMLTLPALRADPRVAMTGAFDIRADARWAFEAEFGSTAHDRLDGLFADPTVDAVYIATPHELHAVQTIAALRAGKHVLVEKPMAISVADCAAMVAASRVSGRVLMVGPSHGFDEPVRIAADIVALRRFGDVRMVTTSNFTDFMYRPRRPEELGPRGGVVYNQAAHQIDVVRRLVGQSVATIRAVAGTWDRARGAEGAYAAFLTFAGGAVATLTYSGYAHYDSDENMGWISELGYPKDPMVYGAARRTLAALSQGGEGDAKSARGYGAAQAGAVGTAPHHEHFGPVLLSCEKADLKLLPTGIEIYGDDLREFIAIDPPAVPRARVIDDFVAAISDPKRSRAHDGRWGMQTMACCAALNESSNRGAEIDLNAFMAAHERDTSS